MELAGSPLNSNTPAGFGHAHADGIEIHGWATIAHPLARNPQTAIHIWVDGVPIQELPATLPRPDLARIGVYECCGFRFALPLPVLTGKSHHIQVKHAATGKTLPNGDYWVRATLKHDVTRVSPNIIQGRIYIEELPRVALNLEAWENGELIAATETNTRRHTGANSDSKSHFAAHEYTITLPPPKHNLQSRRIRLTLAGQPSFPITKDITTPVVDHLFSAGYSLQSNAYEHVADGRLTAFAPRNSLALVYSLEPQRPASPNRDGAPEFPIATLPLHQLAEDGDRNCWQSLGPDPYFRLLFHNRQGLSAGWYRVEVYIECARTPQRAKLYLDYGAGFNEKEAFWLQYDAVGRASRCIHLAQPAVDVRFDPTEGRERFRVKLIQFRLLTERDAANEMIAELRAKSKWHKDSPEDLGIFLIQRAKKSGKTFATQLLTEYSALFAVAESANYSAWIEHVEKPTLPPKAEIRHHLRGFRQKPLISIVMPTYNSVIKHLRSCLDSVLEQDYPHWELCIADDASTDPAVIDVLTEYAERDRRIKVMRRTRNGHISRASNTALKRATGDFVALLDHDDVLAPEALFFVAKAVNENIDAQVLYSDEDKLDELERRVEPHFKSGWNPDLLFSQNYICHLVVLRRALVESVKGFSVGVEGSQDHDLILRCTAKLSPRQIVHIPRVLYHWRMAEGSTARASGEKLYTTESGTKAVGDHFRRMRARAKVGPGLIPNTYRVSWLLPRKPPLVSLLIPTRDRRDLTETCVRSILEKTNYKNFEIIIIDNGSIEPETLEFFSSIQKEDRRVRVLRYNRPFNFSAINNYAAERARGAVIGLINNDIEVISSGWLTEMVSHALRPEIGCVGAKLYYPDDTIQHAGVICSVGGVAGHSHKHYPRDHHGYFGRLAVTQNLSAVTAACLIVRAAVYKEVGGLDSRNLKIAFNDVDFCLKVRKAGYRNVWTPFAELYHHESVSRGEEDSPGKAARFRREITFMNKKWGAELQRDPYYNPNLTKSREDFSLDL